MAGVQAIAIITMTYKQGICLYGYRAVDKNGCYAEEIQRHPDKHILMSEIIRLYPGVVFYTNNVDFVREKNRIQGLFTQHLQKT